ncbi:hypothetical protein [Rhodococcus opacus]|uniref:hypothetical protein n=1 Tax=Rhodococcus opacus TaxID=37919 RepID=UPI001C20BF9D|nr:hypothetical protein [Rhodococcus opacus]
MWNEKVSIDFAARAYGVVIDQSTLSVDDDATRLLRDQLRTRQTAGDWSPPVAGYHPWPQRWADLERL